jgi:hypothetical protein
VLDQLAELEFYSASLLKQQSTDRRSLHLDTVFWFLSHQSSFLLLNAACLAEKQHKPIW